MLPLILHTHVELGRGQGRKATDHGQARLAALGLDGGRIHAPPNLAIEWILLDPG